MISLQSMFYIFVIFFALIGSLRGWQREVLALSGLIASIAALHQFGNAFVPILVNAFPGAVGVDGLVSARYVFYVQAIFHCTIAFFSYQVVARLAENVSAGRLGDRLRNDFQRRFIGFILGALNGYMLVGGLWSFLEFKLTPVGYEQLLPGELYPFDPTVIARPVVDGIPNAIPLVEYLPLAIIAPTWWLLFFFIVFFIVIVALI